MHRINAERNKTEHEGHSEATTEDGRVCRLFAPLPVWGTPARACAHVSVPYFSSPVRESVLSLFLRALLFSLNAMCSHVLADLHGAYISLPHSFSLAVKDSKAVYTEMDFIFSVLLELFPVPFLFWGGGWGPKIPFFSSLFCFVFYYLFFCSLLFYKWHHSGPKTLTDTSAKNT